MDFFLLLIVTGTLFVRPAELIPALQALPIYEIAILACTAVSFPRILDQLSLQSLRTRPITACVVGLLFAVVMSHLSHFYITGARMSGFEFFKVLLYYLLLVGILSTPGRLITFLYALVAFTIVLTVLALLQYHHLVEIPALAQFEQWEFNPLTGERTVIPRLRSTGIFNDPNDLSMILAVSILISLHGLTDRRLGMLRMQFLAPLGLFGYALMLTHSRGGLLALGVGLFVLLWLKYGARRAMLLAAPAIVALPLLVRGRQTDFSGALEGGTGQSRIQLWSEGLGLFRQAPAFGIGKGNFVEEVRHVAHNSFIQMFAELGFFGGALFLGAFVVAVSANYRLMRADRLIEDPRLRRLSPFMVAVLSAYFVSMLALSRSYTAPTYMVLALACVLPALAGAWRTSVLPRFDGRLVQQIAIQGVCYLTLTYVYVRVFARWS